MVVVLRPVGLQGLYIILRMELEAVIWLLNVIIQHLKKSSEICKVRLAFQIKASWFLLLSLDLNSQSFSSHFHSN